MSCVAARFLRVPPGIRIAEFSIYEVRPGCKSSSPMNRQELKSKAIAATNQLLRTKGYVSIVDVLLSMGKLSKENHDRWRFRQVPYLEKVIPGNLSQFQFLLRTVRAYALTELQTKPSRTVYTSWGKGRREPLRFTKFNQPYLEDLYSTHFVSPQLAKQKHDLASATPKSASEVVGQI